MIKYITIYYIIYILTSIYTILLNNCFYFHVWPFRVSSDDLPYEATRNAMGSATTRGKRENRTPARTD